MQTEPIIDGDGIDAISGGVLMTKSIETTGMYSGVY